jgi:hypothetical protein
VFDVRSGADAGRRLGDRGDMSAEGGLVRGGRRGRWIAVAAGCAAALAWAAAPAQAADGVIPGNPLTIYANDSGQLQVAFAGSSTGEFFLPSLQPANGGLNIAVTQGSSPFAVYGFRGSPFLPAGTPTVTGDGSAGNPWVLSTSYNTDTPGTNLAVVVNQKLTYVNGTTDVGVQYTFEYQGDLSGPVNLRAYEAADLYVSGNDAGAGFFAPGPPRQVGGINQAQGSSARLVEQSPAWSHYQEGRYSDVFDVVGAAGTFNDTIDPTLLDNGVGVQWDGISLATQGSSATVQVVWRFRHFTPLTLSLAAAAKAQGQIATATVTARNSDGNPDPGRSVRYAIAGANPGAGAVTTGADGNAAITWTGVKQGADTLTAFVDVNSNGVRDADEPEQSATVTFGGPLPPVPGKSVVARVVSGQVLIKYPPGYVPRASGAASGFVPFAGAANIPVGSQIDTKKGRVAVTSAADTGAVKTQTSDFYQGIFQVKQSVPKTKPKKPAALTTDLVMKGQISRSQCAPLKGARAAATKKKKGPKAVLGKLWGSGKGKFRTNGKYSAATVRGTIWLVEDRCEGTLTKVRRGAVQVRDFKRKKTVTVKAGHTYLARAQRAASKSRR